MNTKKDQEEATLLLLADYEPVESEFREHALMEWRAEENGKTGLCMACAGNIYGLPWKHVRLEVEN